MEGILILGLIEGFSRYLQTERSYSAHTVLAYVSDTEEFRDYLHSFQPIDPEDETWPSRATHRTIRSWMSALLDADIGKRSLARKIASLNAFYRFLLKTGKVETNPARRVAVPKADKKLPVFLKQDETEKLFSSDLFSPDFSGIRDKCILEILYGCGLRRAEVVGLLYSDIKMNTGVLKVLGKGNKERIVPFGKNVHESFSMYMKACEDQGFDYTGHFFLTDQGNMLYPRYVHSIVNKYLAQISSLSQRSPHVLRHTFATHLLDEGADLNAIKEMLGHTSLAATQVYVHNSIAKLKKVYRQAHPKA